MDPETFANHIITIQGAMIAPFFVTDISIGIRKGIKHHQPKYYNQTFNNHLDAVSNNLISFLCNREINFENDFIRSSGYVVVVFTLINLIITFLFINIYLKIKHSESISIAERSNLYLNRSFISFQTLLLVIILWGLIGLCNYQIHNTNYVKTTTDPPPLVYIICFLTVFLSLLFLFSKRNILDYLKRRVANRCQESFRKLTERCRRKTREDEGPERRVAWA